MTTAGTTRGAPALPDEFDDFEIVRPLGAGGMGTVYVARERSLDRLVAIKLIAASTRDRHARERFAIEARAIARLQHPNVVALYRVGEVESRPYLAYELIAGRRLDELPRPAAWQWLLRVALGMARGLGAAHARGVLHRDIKPANVMVSEDGDVKLIDFGLARVLDTGAEPGPASGASIDGRLAELTSDEDAITQLGVHAHDEHRLTEAGIVVGTPLYLAPELWQGDSASARSDIYALGLVLYEMLAGDLPHAGLRGVAMARHVIDRDAPPLGGRVPEVPRAFAELVDRCVRRTPEQRPSTVQEIRDQLEALASLYRPFFSDTEGAIDQDRVRSSFERVLSDEGALVVDFYTRWMAAEPEIRPLFRGDMATQRVMLITAIKLAVDNLNRPERLVPLLEDLGRRHVGRGVEPRFFASMGQALLDSLAVRDRAWDEATAAAWGNAFTRIAQVVQRAIEAGDHAARAAGQRWEVPLAPARTRWAPHGDADLAYQEIGDGAVDVAILGEWVTHVELAWRQPALASLLRQLASIGRVLLIDRRGTGLSDREPAPSAEAQADDVVAVLDRARCDRAIVLAIGDACAPAALLTATRPERVRALVLYGAGHGAADPARIDRDALEEAVAAVRVRWGTPLFVDRLAPSLAKDAAYRAWWAELLRTAASPRSAGAMLRVDAAVDVRAVLPSITTPTLVVHRRGDRWRPFAGARGWAAQIPGARLEMLPGDDHVPWAGDREALLARVQDFLRESGEVPAPVAGTTGDTGAIAT